MAKLYTVAPELCEFADLHIALKHAPDNPEVRRFVSKEKARMQKAALAAQPKGRLARHAIIDAHGSLWLVRLTRGKASKSRKPRIVCRAKRVEWSAWTVGWANCEHCASEVWQAWQTRIDNGALRIAKDADGNVTGWYAQTAEDRRMTYAAAAREVDGTAYRRRN